MLGPEDIVDYHLRKLSRKLGISRLDLFAPRLEIARQADGLELTGDDEIEHLASIDTQQASGIRPAHERRAARHAEPYSLASCVGQPRYE